MELTLKEFTKSLFSFVFLFCLFLTSMQFKGIHPLLLDYDATFFLQLAVIPAFLVLIPKEPFPQFNTAGGVALLFFLWVALSFFWSVEGLYATRKFLLFLLYTIPCYFIGHWLNSSQNESLRRLFFLLSSLGIITLLLCLFQFFWGGGSLMFVFGANYLITGQTLGISIIILLVYGNHLFHQTVLKYGVFSTSLVMYALLFQLGGRGPVVAISLCLLVWIICGLRGERTPHLSLKTCLLGGGFLGFILMVFCYVTGTYPPFFTRFEGFLEGAFDANVLERFDYYKSAWSCFLEHPFRGIGLGGWPSYYGFSPQTDIHPHNIFLEVLSETGIIGFILLSLFLTLHLGRGLYQFRQASPEAQIIGLGLLFSFLNALKTGDLKGNLIFFTFLGMVASSKYGKTIMSAKTDKERECSKLLSPSEA